MSRDYQAIARNEMGIPVVEYRPALGLREVLQRLATQRRVVRFGLVDGRAYARVDGYEYTGADVAEALLAWGEAQR